MNFLRLVVFNQVREVSTVIKSLDHVAGFMIGKSYPGPVQDLLGEARSLGGEESVLGALLIWLQENAHLTQFRFWSLDQNLLIYKNGGIAKNQAQKSLVISSLLKLVSFKYYAFGFGGM